MKNCIGPEWDSNPRPAVYMTAALTNWTTRPLAPEKPVSWYQSVRAVACGVVLPLMFSCTTQLTLMELRTTSKLPWQIYFRLATGDIYIFGELSVKYQWGPPLSPGGDRSQLMISEWANQVKYWHFPPTTPCETQCNSSDEKLHWAWVGFEPTTCCLHDSRSNQLSYQATGSREASFLISISQSSPVWSSTPSYVLLHHSVNTHGT